MEHPERRDDSTTMSRRQLIARGAAVGGGLMLGGGVLAAPGMGASTQDEADKSIGFAMSTFVNPRYPRIDLPGFKAAAYGAGYRVLYNQADGDPAKQISNVNALLSRNVKALALLAVNSNAAVSLVTKAKRQGVPVLCYNTPIPSGDLAGFVGRDNSAMGQLIANAALQKTGLKGNWAILGGDPGNAVARETVVGFDKVIKSYVANGTMNIVGRYDEPAFDTELARKQIQEVLTKVNNKLDGILCMWEGGVIGSLAALRDQGLGGKVWVGGQDATAVSCRGLLTGEVAMSGFTQFDVMAQQGGRLTAQLARGEKLKSKFSYDTGHGKIPFFPIRIYPVTLANLVPYLKQYSPVYVNAKTVFEGIPESKSAPKGRKRSWLDRSSGDRALSTKGGKGSNLASANMADTNITASTVDAATGQSKAAELRAWRTMLLVASIAVTWVIFNSLTDHVYLTARNLTNLSVEAAPTALVALGVAALIVARELDLSVGSTLAVVVVVSVFGQAAHGWGTGATIVVAIGIGLAVGLVNGLVTAIIAVPSFIATLAAFSYMRGIAYAITNGETPAGTRDSFQQIAYGELPALAVFSTCAVIAGWRDYSRFVGGERGKRASHRRGAPQHGRGHCRSLAP